jgi:hypothetical protein
VPGDTDFRVARVTTPVTVVYITVAGAGRPLWEVTVAWRTL